MLPVEILPLQDSVVLRARGSELLILPHHVVQLKDKKDPRSFSEYFMRDALLNRPARKLFEAWLRKDGGLWRRMFDVVHDMKVSEEGDKDSVKPETKSAKTVKSPSEAKLTKPSAKAPEKKAEAKKETKAPKAEIKVEAKAEVKKIAKKEEAPAKVVAKKPAKEVAKAPAKKEVKAVAKAPKKAEKPAAKKDSKPASKAKKGSKG